MMRTDAPRFFLTTLLFSMAACTPASTKPATTSTSVIVAPSSPLVGPTKPPTQSDKQPRGTSLSRLTPLSEHELKAQVTPHLRQGERLAFPAQRGPLGPYKNAIVVLTESNEKGATTFAGFLVVATSDGTAKRLALPKLHDAWSGHAVRRIFLAHADEDSSLEAVIMADYVTGIGPDGAKPFSFKSVIGFDGSQFVRHATLEKSIEGLETVAAIQERLKHH